MNVYQESGINKSILSLTDLHFSLYPPHPFPHGVIVNSMLLVPTWMGGMSHLL